MWSELTGGQMGLVRGSLTMAAPCKYPLELRDRAVRMYRTAEPKPQIKTLAVDLGVHPEALRGWIRQAEADAGEREALQLAQASVRGREREPLRAAPALASATSAPSSSRRNTTPTRHPPNERT